MAKSDEWATPPDLMKVLDNEFHFSIEVCAAKDNRALPDIPYLGLDNGKDALKTDWAKDNEDVIYCNCPYSKLPEFIAKAHWETVKSGCTAVLLIPAYTDTQYWDNFIWDVATEIRFLKGRLRFWDSGKPGKDTARFPSALVVFDFKGWQPMPQIGRWNWKAASKV